MIRIDVGDEDSKRSDGVEIKAGRVYLPQKYTRGKEISVDILTGLLVIAAVIVALFPQPLLRQYKIMVTKRHHETMGQLKKEVANLESEINNLRPYKSELESYRKQQGLVEKRLAVVRNLLAERGTPVNVLDSVGQNLSRRTWLKNMKFTLVGTRALSLAGSAYSNEEISDYVDRLSESVFLTDVTLKFVRNNGSLGLKDFELSANPIVSQK